MYEGHGTDTLFINYEGYRAYTNQYLEFVYDSDGLTQQINRHILSTHELFSKKEVTWWDRDQIKSVTSFKGSEAKLNVLEFDRMGNWTRWTDFSADGMITKGSRFVNTYRPDAQIQQRLEVDQITSDSLTLWRYVYNADGQLATMFIEKFQTAQDKVRVEYTYDAENRLEEEKRFPHDLGRLYHQKTYEYLNGKLEQKLSFYTWFENQTTSFEGYEIHRYDEYENLLFSEYYGKNNELLYTEEFGFLCEN
ncbi:MAG: hypothetical protein AAF587_15095 [Bacteroidota bacterium]